jgi:type IV pilus assembly protein PilC
MILFTRQFATLLAAGMPLLRALDIAAGQAETEGFQRTMAALQDDVRSGSSLAQSMERHPRYFSPLYTSLIQVGEVSGTLPEVLRKMIQYLEREHDLKMKLRRAASYPALMLALASGAGLVILLFVLPVFSDLFYSSGAELPGLTRMLLAASAWFSRSWPILLLAAGVFLAGVIAWVRTEEGKTGWHRFLLRARLIGAVNRQVMTSRMAFVLALMVRSGVPLLQALDTARGVMSNVCCREALDTASRQVLAGQRLSRPLRESGLFDAAFLHMLEVGEETGAMDDMLQSMADYYDNEVGYRMDTVLAWIEPVFILVVGGLIGTLVIATLLPMFDLMSLL